jgi:hypothetical protein
MYVSTDVVYYGNVCANARTAILIIIEGHETAFNGFWYQFTTGKLLKCLKLALNYYENGSMDIEGCLKVFVFVFVFVDLLCLFTANVV